MKGIMAQSRGVQRADSDATRTSRANLAAGLAAVAVGVYVMFIAVDAEGPIWIVQGLTSLAAVVAGWRAGSGSTPRGRALAAMVIGGLLFVSFVVFAILEA